MITYQKIGNYGRLGNQMFQYAVLVGISECTGYDFGYSPGRLWECFNINIGKQLLKPVEVEYHYTERRFDFNDDVFSLPDSVDITGYFQTEKYWHHCRSKVINQFKFRNKIPNLSEDFTSLHIRRGDYVDLKTTHTCLSDTDYYDQAIELIDPKKIIVFTDDKQWLTKSGNLERWRLNRDVIICEEQTDIDELQMMTQARHSIIANSSFSWWGAYLGPHQKRGRVIAPSVWFGPNGPKIWKDIYCDGWEII
jgi:hypothetical protein